MPKAAAEDGELAATKQRLAKVRETITVKESRLEEEEKKSKDDQNPGLISRLVGELHDMNSKEDALVALLNKETSLKLAEKTVVGQRRKVFRA